ncbi:hypothetical protein ST47_g7753 [Ascochyta rabiei]|uniref:Uncharacterized protein n=1 Tax=Didymella rabiei TaxID=5454 RepID=A0A163AA52_DIDRA|nr:hypothetical protein ST47_g7753 [Ascochyta rabiei]
MDTQHSALQVMSIISSGLANLRSGTIDSGYQHSISIPVHRPPHLMSPPRRPWSADFLPASDQDLPPTYRYQYRPAPPSAYLPTLSAGTTQDAAS